MNNNSTSGFPLLLIIHILLFPFIFATLLFSTPPFAFAQMEIYWDSLLSFSQEYDDNIYLTETDTEEDFITILSESLRLGLRGEDFDGSIDVSLGYSFYKEEEDNNSIRSNINFSNFKAFPLSENVFLDLDGFFNISEDPVEIDELIASDRRSRNRYYRNRSSAKVTYQFGEEEFIYWGFGNTLLINSDSELEDSVEYKPSFGLSYWFNSYHGFTADTSYAKANFDVSSDFDEFVISSSYIWRFKETTRAIIAYAKTSRDFDGVDTQDYRFMNMTVGLSHQFSDSLLASVNAGRYSQNVSGVDDATGLSWSATLAKDFENISLSANAGYYQQNPDDFSINREFSGSLSLSKFYEYSTISITGGRSFREQFFEAENLGFTKEETLLGTYSIQPSENLEIDVTALYRKNEYVELGFPRTDDVWQVGTSISYRIFEWLAPSFSFSHRERNSDLPGNRYKGNRFFLTFSYPHEGKPIEF